MKAKTRITCLLLASLSFLGGCKGNGQTKDTEMSSAGWQPQTSQVSLNQDSRRSEALAAIEQGLQSAGNESEPASDTSVSPSVPAGDAVLGEDGLYYKDGIIIVNKKHGVPADYAPGVDPTAQAQVSALISEMMSQGLDVSYDTSNFRSYDYQSQLYNGYVAANGQAEADTFSARPGFSEHQTGLAFDLKHSSGALITNPAEAQWLLDNCARYGFIVRYQEGRESITGYQAEPWHLRYIGDRAQEIMDSGLTLEEYLGVEGGTEY